MADKYPPYIKLTDASRYENNSKLIKLEMKVTNWSTGVMEPYNHEYLRDKNYSCNNPTVSTYSTVNNNNNSPW